MPFFRLLVWFAVLHSWRSCLAASFTGKRASANSGVLIVYGQEQQWFGFNPGLIASELEAAVGERFKLTGIVGFKDRGKIFFSRQEVPNNAILEAVQYVIVHWGPATGAIELGRNWTLKELKKKITEKFQQQPGILMRLELENGMKLRRLSGVDFGAGIRVIAEYGNVNAYRDPGCDSGYDSDDDSGDDLSDSDSEIE